MEEGLMKEINYMGVNYSVPDWANYIASDRYFVKIFEAEPYLCIDMWSGTFGKRFECLEKSNISNEFKWEWSKTKI
jgi:hypothetical protein